MEPSYGAHRSSEGVWTLARCPEVDAAISLPHFGDLRSDLGGQTDRVRDGVGLAGVNSAAVSERATACVSSMRRPIIAEDGGGPTATNHRAAPNNRVEVAAGVWRRGAPSRRDPGVATERTGSVRLDSVQPPLAPSNLVSEVAHRGETALRTAPGPRRVDVSPTLASGRVPGRDSGLPPSGRS